MMEVNPLVIANIVKGIRAMGSMMKPSTSTITSAFAMTTHSPTVKAENTAAATRRLLLDTEFSH